MAKDKKSGNLEDLVYRKLIERIIRNQIKPGNVILETELSEILKISRTPVRQALGRLVAEGFLERKPKKGCIISLLNPEDAEEVFSAREIIESKVAAFAAMRAKEDEIKKLYKILDEESEAVARNDKTQWAVVNEKFHYSIMKAARNKYLERYCHHILLRSAVYTVFFDSFYLRSEGFKGPPELLTTVEHPRILKAIENKNPEHAKFEMANHIRGAYETLIGMRKDNTSII
jgi:DNA-binding GntR family transcriptional regulator